MRGKTVPIAMLIALVLVGTAVVPPLAAAQEPPVTLQEPPVTIQETPATAPEPPANPWFVTVIGGVYSAVNSSRLRCTCS